MIFFTIVIAIYSFANIYIFIKGYGAIQAFQKNRILYLAIFLLFASSFIAGKILESRHSTVFSDVLNVIGGFWLAFLLYGFLFLFLSDIISIPLRLTGIINSNNITAFKKWSYLATLAASFLLIAGGFINALSPRTTEYSIQINKAAGDLKEMKIAAVSDIHLGSIIRKRSIKKLSELLKKAEPDLVLLLGDIVDGEIGPVLRGDLLQYFSCPQCKAGTYAITGNHEFIGGGARTIPYIESKGIRVLKDEVISIEGGIQIAGRLDRDSRRFFGKERLPLAQLLAGTDKSKPVFLLDHQPYHLDDAVDNGVDLQLSGHTHNGQMWPLNLITSRHYELSYGYMKKGNTQFIVSSGFGLWGPRVRIGSRPEIVVLNISFTNTGSGSTTDSYSNS